MATSPRHLRVIEKSGSARGFRRDIQGLRALAVLLVTLFHFVPDAVPGGYIGVDIFFVISGFLITGHMMKEVNATGTINVFEFWARRMRRLLPAAFTVLLFSLVSAYYFLTESQWLHNFQEISAAAFYILNWVLAANSVDYLARDNHPSIVEHYWSLSVEEQFYIFTPLLIIAIVFLAWRVFHKNVKPAVMGLYIVIIFASFAYALYYTPESTAAYFVTTTRAWEFAFGGFIALLPANALSQSMRGVLAWFGWALMVVAAFTFDASTPFPGPWAVIPVVGAGIALYAQESDLWWSPQFLTKNKPTQLLGDASYSIYLWHWPILVIYLNVVGAYPSVLHCLAMLAVVGLVGLASKYWIEDPLRKGPGPFRLKPVTYATTAVCMCAFFAVSAAYTHINERNVARAQEEAKAAQSAQQAQIEGEEAGKSTSCFGADAVLNNCEHPFDVTEAVNPAAVTTNNVLKWAPPEGCHAEVDSAGWPLWICDEPVANATVKVALVGDSHGWQYLSPIEQVAKRQGWSFEAWTYLACSPLKLTLEEGDKGNVRECVDSANKEREHLLSATDIDYVILAIRLDGASGSKAQELAKYIQDLRASGKKVVWLRQTPGTLIENKGMSAPECIEKSEEKTDPCSFSVKKGTWTNGVKAAQRAGATVVDPWQIVCPNSRCHYVIGGTIVYADDNHFSWEFAQSLTPWLSTELTKIITP